MDVILLEPHFFMLKTGRLNCIIQKSVYEGYDIRIEFSPNPLLRWYDPPVPVQYPTIHTDGDIVAARQTMHSFVQNLTSDAVPDTNGDEA